MSSIVNKVKDALHSDKSETSTTTHPTSTHHTASSRVPEGTAGPHGRVGNTVDPTVDSGLDRSHNVHNHTTGTGAGYSGVGTTTGSTNHGPHGSNMANKADPRVDSDRDHRATHNTAGNGLTGTTGGYDGTHTTTGPHSSVAANKLDPRVDTKGASIGGGTGAGVGGFDGSHTGTHNPTHGTHSAGTYGSSGIPEGTAGPHGRVGNTVDPTVDSDLDRNHAARNHATGTYNTTGSHPTGTHGAAHHGTAHNTIGTYATGAGYGAETGNVGNPKSTNAGPHGSNILNTLDPRVDSDLNGSKTFGGDKTYSHGNNTTTGRDHSDASQVSPSVLAAHKGEPIITHDHTGANHAGRHGFESGQNGLSGI